MALRRSIYYVGAPKLFTKIKCSVCADGKRNVGYSSCPYCNLDREMLIEAPLSVIKDYLCLALREEERAEIIALLRKRNSEKVI